MKCNKIALSLILLTSSAFASFLGKSDQELENDAEYIKTFSDAKWKEANEKNQKKPKKKILVDYINLIDLDGKLVLNEYIKKRLIGKLFDDGSTAILDILKEARAKDISDAADFIFVKCGANGVSSIALSDYDSKLTTEQYEKIKAFEQNSGGLPLEKDEIEDFLLNGNLPTPLTPVEIILKVAGTDKVSSKELSDYKSVLNENQYEAIKKYEKYYVKLLNEDDLKNFIDNGSLPDLDADEKKKAILDLSTGKVGEVNGISDYATNKQIEVIKKKETESNSRIDEDLLEKILKASNEAELEELAKPVAVPSPSPSPAPAPAPAPKTLTQVEIAAEILNYVEDGKIDTAHKADLESLKLTTGQVDKLLAATDLDADKIDEILKSSDALPSPAPPATAPKTLTQDEIAAEILNYVEDGKIDTAHKADLESLKLTTGQVDKLLAATDLDADKIDEILKSSDAPPSPSPPSPAPAPAPPAPSPAPPAPKTLTKDEMAAEIVKLYVKDGKIDKSHKDALVALKLTTGQVDKLLAETGLDANKIKAILNAPDATPAATPKPLTEAEIAKEIFGKYLKDGKINSDDVSKKAIMALGITSAQFDKLVAIDKIDSVTKIEENLKATAPAPASANTKINIDFAAILKIAAANAGKIVEANRDALKLLGLSAAQIDLLLTASGLDSVDKIEKLLITGTEPSNNEKPKTTEIKAEAAEKGDGANGPWYTSGWVLGISGILIISAIGGGAYIITRKSNETDL
jgi:uncharacterized protein YwbE